MKTYSTCWKRWRCMESDREYACREYEKKARKRNGKKRIAVHTYSESEPAEGQRAGGKTVSVGRAAVVLVSCGGWLRGRYGGGNWGNDGDCTERCDVLEKTDE